jgi:Flp pilus assembly protein TadB
VMHHAETPTSQAAPHTINRPYHMVEWIAVERDGIAQQRRASDSMETERAPAPRGRAQEWSGARTGGVDSQDTIIPSSGISLRLWRLYAYFWLVCLLFPILALVQTHPAPVHWFIALAGLAIFVISYFWVMWPHLLRRGEYTRSPVRSWLLIVMLTTLVLFLSLVYGSAFLWLFVG